MHCYLNCWPGGKTKCLTLSYDDGVPEDRRLVEIMNRHGLRGSFHLNSRNLESDKHVRREELASVYAGHEVSVHMCSHPFPTRLTREGNLVEVIEDRRQLESAVSYPVRGMSYPFGDYDARVVDLLAACGIEYARTVNSHGGFHLPARWLEWHPTCHHNQCMELGDKFLAESNFFNRGLMLFYVWGHSYEFPRAGNWDMIEAFSAKLGNRSDIWYATNIEIVDYVNALRAVRSSIDGNMLQNPSAISIWFLDRNSGQVRELKPGELLHLG